MTGSTKPSVGTSEADVGDWKVRQAALPYQFHGEVLEPSEVEALEHLLALGEELDWIPRDQTRRPTNDFLWLSRGRLPTELKTTKASYRTIHGRVVAAASQAAKQQVVKENFLIHIRRSQLTTDLYEALCHFNVGRRKYRLAHLWVLTRGEIVEIPLVDERVERHASVRRRGRSTVLNCTPDE